MRGPSPNRPALLQLIAISWSFGWPVATGVIVGSWLDGKLGSSPVATLSFGLGAMAAAVWRMLQLSKEDAIEREIEEERDAHDEHDRRDPT